MLSEANVPGLIYHSESNEGRVFNSFQEQDLGGEVGARHSSFETINVGGFAFFYQEIGELVNQDEDIGDLHDAKRSIQR